MKPEVYSCLKMLEAFNFACIRICRTRDYDSANSLGVQYVSIRRVLEEHLNEAQIRFVPHVATETYHPSKVSFIHELISASSIGVAYLRSLEGSFDKELKQKETELKMREEYVDSLEKLLEKSIKSVSQLPELQRSRIVEEIKKSHRGIEKHTKKKD